MQNRCVCSRLATQTNSVSVIPFPRSSRRPRVPSSKHPRNKERTACASPLLPRRTRPPARAPPPRSCSPPRPPSRSWRHPSVSTPQPPMPGEMTAGTPRTLPRTSPIPPRIVLVSRHRCLSQRRTPRRGTIRRRARPDARFADMCFPRDRGEITRLSSPPTVADRIPPHVSPSDRSDGPATRSSAPPVPPPSACSPSTAVPFTSSPMTASRPGARPTV